MKVTMVMVASVNGKITKGDNPDVRAWTSDEDAALFASIKENATVIIMGSKTYEVARAKMKLKPGTLRVVMTRDPQKFAADSVSGQLEFTSEFPKELIVRLAARGLKEALLFGGGETNALFLESKLVDEIRLTIEPLLLSTGKSLVSDMLTDIQLKLMSTEKLNDKGTLHLVYEVIK